MRAEAALGFAAAVALAACATSRATSQPVTSPTTGDELYSIACEASPNECLDEAKRRCPGGYRTVEAGRAGWYADDEQPFATQSVLEERHNYKQAGWVVACHRW